MKPPKNLLDERQQQELARISAGSVRITFWIAITSLLIKCYALDLPAVFYTTELIILLATGLFQILCSIKAGIYDPYFRPTAGTSAAISAITGLAVGGAKFAGLWVRRPDLHANWFMTIGMASLIMGIVIFILCFAALLAVAALVQRRQRRLEAQWEDDLKG